MSDSSDTKDVTDSVLRAMTDDGAFRVITTRTTETVRGILAAQAPPPRTARTFADLITGVVLIRETMAPQLRVQGILKRPKVSDTLVADSFPTGDTRGLVSLRESSPDFLAEGSVLQMMRTLHNGRIHQGMVAVPETGSVSEALMIYMQESEQIATMIAVDTIFDGDELTMAGGYLVQLLPEVGRGPLAVMTERLEDYRTIENQLRAPNFDPSSLIDDLLYAMPFTTLGDSAVRYHCWCSQTSLLTALSTLPRSEIEEIIRDGQTLEITCDYCQTEYRVAPAELTGLLHQS